jgi:phage/plasmid-like protein (TIGR03299 family)
MADMIDGNKFAYTYQPAWHGKGKKIEPGTSVTDGAIQCGLDYEVVKRPLYYYDHENNKYVRMKNRNAIIRNTDGNQYGVSSDNKYTIMQNMEVFEKLNFLLGTGLVELDCMGALKGGEIAWALLKPTDKQALEVQPGDAVDWFAMFSIHHDAKSANYLGFTDRRVVCNNTMQAAIRSENSKLLRILHSSRIYESTDAAIEAMNCLRGEFEANVELYRKLTGINMKDKEKYVRLVLNLEGKDSTRANNIVDKVLGLVRGDTAWDAYNAITEYTTHMAGSDAEKRLTSLWFGSNAKVNQNALNVLAEIA